MKRYTLQTPKGAVTGGIKGALGGHRKLKIYGRLDCPSALRYLAKGQYKQHRVFFLSEDTAIACGYRPCARCLPVAYRAWKVAQCP